MRLLSRALPGFSGKNPLIILGAVFLLIYAAFALGDMVLANDMTGLAFVGLAFVGAVFVLTILKDWRKGVYVFFGWLFFEDLARKYLGNNMVVYFGKDALVAIVYLSFFLRFRKHEVPFYKPPFYVPLMLFFWLGVIQLFNPSSNSIYIGLLGMKLYFYYVPLFFVGFAFLRTDVDLRKLFAFFMLLILIVTSLGIVQSILGHTFLNPTVLQEDIRDLSTTYRVAPISGVTVYRPNSVFVSGGRFSFLLVPAWLFSFGLGAYLIFRSKKYRMLTLLALGSTTVAVVLAASRGTLLWTFGSALVGIPMLVWGCPWEKGQLVRIYRSIQRTLFGAVAALIVIYLLYPDAVKGRLTVYSETLDPNSSASELVHRTRTYPLQQFLYAFDYPLWPYGYGIGTASLGLQYVSRILHVASMGVGVESGFGDILLELGIVGLLFYLVLAVSIIFSAWKVVLRLRGSPLFPIGFVIFWYALLFLFPYLWGGFQSFQDFILNALLWFTLGVLYRLPSLPLPLVEEANPLGRRVTAVA